MKKINLKTFIVTFGFFTSCNSICAQNNEVIINKPQKKDIAEIIHLVNRYWQKNNPTHGNFFWNRAVYHVGNMEAYKATGDCGYLDFSTEWAEYNQWKGAKSDNKEEWLYSYGESDRYVLFGDCQICFQVYADLYNVIPEEKRIARAIEVMEYQISTPVIDYWWWVDGLFMVMPVMTKLYNITGNDLLLEKMYQYWEYSNSIMFDYDENLYYRDERYVYPKHQTHNGKKDFWSRGDGWIFAAFARIIEELPQTDKHRDTYITFFKNMAASLAKAQQSEGYWTRSLLDPEYAPGYETSGTSMYAYGYAWGINNGILSEEEYGDNLIKAWDYLTKTALNQDGHVGYIQPIGDKADPNQTINKYSTADFGVGAFLMAACEMLKYAEGDKQELDLRITSLKNDDNGKIYITFNDTINSNTANDINSYHIDGETFNGTVEFDGIRNVIITLDDKFEGGKHTFDAYGIISDNGVTAGENCKGDFISTISLTPCEPFISVEAIGNQIGNTPENTIDNRLDTRWSQDGLNQWIKYDLKESKYVNAVDIAFYLGDQRKNFFDIKVSEDDKNYITVLNDAESCGLTEQLERFSFEKQKARYVLINCKGNSQGGANWNSITEVRIRWEDDETHITESFDEKNYDIIDGIINKGEKIKLNDFGAKSDDFNIMIYDMSGKLVIKEETSILPYYINNNLERGQYILKMYSHNNSISITEKFIVQ